MNACDMSFKRDLDVCYILRGWEGVYRDSIYTKSVETILRVRACAVLVTLRDF